MPNASLSSIARGLKPIRYQRLGGVEYFLFRNGQIRRQIGHGHSHEERAEQRAQRRARRRETKARLTAAA